MPLDKFPIGKTTGRYLNGSAAFNVSMDNGVLLVTLASLEVKGEPTDEATLRHLGQEGVDVLVCDSTNIMVEGTTPSEARVAATLAKTRGFFGTTAWPDRAARRNRTPAHKPSRRAPHLGPQARRPHPQR